MKKQLRDFIFQELIFVENPDQFSDNDDLLEAGLESMGIMRLIIFIENSFGITVPDNEIAPENIQTFNALEQWILKYKTDGS